MPIAEKVNWIDLHEKIDKIHSQIYDSPKIRLKRRGLFARRQS